MRWFFRSLHRQPSRCQGNIIDVRAGRGAPRRRKDIAFKNWLANKDLIFSKSTSGCEGLDPGSLLFRTLSKQMTHVLPSIFHGYSPMEDGIIHEIFDTLLGHIQVRLLAWNHCLRLKYFRQCDCTHCMLICSFVLINLVRCTNTFVYGMTQRANTYFLASVGLVYS